MNILLVEDNLAIIDGLKYALKINNYNVIYKLNIKEAKDFLNTKPMIDLIILDITLPDGNGFQLFKDFIKDLNIPTIFLTAKDEEDNIVSCLNAGAEDYIIKPFSTKELLARINKILLRTERKSIIKVQNISYDLNKFILYKDDLPIELTPIELKIINLLFLNINKVVRRNTLLDKIWEWTGNYVDDHTITVYLKRIREKIGIDIIKTVKGIGYRIDEE